MLERVRAGEERRVGGERGGHRGERLLEDERLLGEGVESGGCVPEVAVEPQVVRAGRVEADHDKVRELGPRRLGAGEQQRGQGESAGAPHGSRSSGAT